MLGLLHREPQASQDAPGLRLAELDVVRPIDDCAQPLERPQLGAEAMRGGLAQQRTPERLQLLAIRTRRPAACGHRWQSVDAALIQHRLPRASGQARHTHCMRGLRRRLARQQHSPRFANAAVPSSPVAFSPCLAPHTFQLSVPGMVTSALVLICRSMNSVVFES